MNNNVTTPTSVAQPDILGRAASGAYGTAAQDIAKKKLAVQQTTTEQRNQTNQRITDFNTKINAPKDNTDMLGRALGGEFGTEAQKAAQEKQKTQQDTPTPEKTTTDPLDAQIQSIQDAGKQQIADIQTRLDGIAKSQGGATANLISSINQIYSARISAMEKSNEGMLKTKTALGQRGGRERYTPMLNASILTDEEMQGHERVAKLEGEMLQLVASAQQAQADNDYKNFNAQYDRIEAVQKDMTNQIMDLHKKAVDEENARLAREKAARDEQKANLESMLKLSEKSAPALAAKLDSFSTPEEQSAFITEYAKIQGIDPMVLFSDVETALTAQQKAAMDLERTQNLIQTSIQSANTASYNATTSRQNADLATQKKADEDKIKEMTGDMSRELQAKTGSDGFVAPSDYKQARQLWIEATGKTSDEFDKTYKGFVNPDSYYAVGLKAID